jgi:hypothetical protein
MRLTLDPVGTIRYCFVVAIATIPVLGTMHSGFSDI